MAEKSAERNEAKIQKEVDTSGRFCGGKDCKANKNVWWNGEKNIGYEWETGSEHYIFGNRQRFEAF